ncbi:MAG: FAD-binding oxidoreductase, partial [Nitrospirota bacterium]|nr:FAD-binding oxidoreductase [Nitrospirota bacterium]
MPDRADVLIIGAGIAGSSLAYELAADASVLLLERESQPGYHSTGRSAAMLTETYGTATVRTLAGASRAFFANPPPGFSTTPLLSPRSMLHIARTDQRAALEDAYRSAAALVPSVRLLDRASVGAAAPLLDPDYAAGGLHEPEAMAIDVAALHQGYLRGLRQRGGELRTGTEITAITRQPAGWQVDAPEACFTADVLVDAAGAWADEVAA